MFILSFIVGFILSMFTLSLNKEKKKNGYQTDEYYGVDRKWDEKLSEDYMKELKRSEESMEFHASQKFN